MKLNKENYELVMFDMLEGNLPDKEAMQAMEQIEADEFFFKEWKAFKATILLPDIDVVFENKHKLLKKDTKVIPMGWWLATAAACLVAAFFLAVPTKVENTELTTVQPTKVETRKETVQPKGIENLPSGKNQITEIDEIDLPFLVEQDKFDSPQVETNLPTKTIVEEPNNQPIVKEDNNPQELPRKDEVDQLTPIVPVIANTTKPNIDNGINEPKQIPFIKKVESFVTSEPKERIRIKSNEIIAMFKNPKLKVKPQFENNKPGLQIEFETSGYQAIASVQPFNKIRN
ncbi:MAG: hypothetical protein RLZZ337_712 [Bacteroidota bacterium]|jgi:hypothetical protein